MTLQPCFSEIDVSIVDRITALLNPQPICRRNAKFVSGHVRNVRVHIILQVGMCQIASVIACNYDDICIGT
jgi:hypothetical protein